MTILSVPEDDDDLAVEMYSMATGFISNFTAEYRPLVEAAIAEYNKQLSDPTAKVSIGDWWAAPGTLPNPEGFGIYRGGDKAELDKFWKIYYLLKEAQQ